MQLTQPIHKGSRERNTTTAIVCGNRRINFGELKDRVSCLAGAFKTLGISPGDRIGMLALNSHRYIEYIYGTLWAGAVLNPINIRWNAREIAYSLDDSDTRVLLIDRAFAELIPSLRELSKSLVVVIYADEGNAESGMLNYETLIANNSSVADARRSGNDLAAILYTGGTTGQPKGVMHSHDSLAINALSAIASAPRPAEIIALHAAPFFHVGGLSFVIQLGARLATQIVMPRFEQTIALQLIEQERVAESFMVPTMLRLLLEIACDYDLSSLRTLLYGAAPINSSLLQLAMSTLPHVDFVQAYGQTEAASVITVLPAPYHTLSGPLAGKLDTAGRPINVAEVRIVDAKDLELANGEIGEICVRGPTVMLGYWNKPEQTAIALREGWLHTGDSGYLDSDGFLHLVDRLNDMIITGGENVYSTEVEDILSRHPDVAMCAVVGIPDERWGEQVHGVVILRVGAHVDEADLIAHCRALIASYKCPRSIEFRSELPISAAGKLLKYVLRDAYWKNQPRRIG